MGMISCDAATAHRQSMMASADFFRDAVRQVSDYYGADYAKDHPELVAAIMRTSADEYRSAMLAHIGDAIEAVACALGSHPMDTLEP